MTALDVPADDLFGLHNLPYGVYSAAGQEARVRRDTEAAIAAGLAPERTPAGVA